MQSLLDQKGRGAFFTPIEMVEPMVRWAVRSAADSVLDGGAGESVFLSAAAERLLELGSSRQQALTQIHGVELDDVSAEIARKAVSNALGVDELATGIRSGSFFDHLPGSIPEVDACIGNPPYIRYQSFAGDARRSALLRAAEAGVKLSGLSSSWAPFLVHTCRFLTPDGRLAQVLPAELLQTGYAEPIREFLTHRFRSVLLIVFDARVFPGALEEVVLVLAGPEGRSGLQVREASDLGSLEDLLERRSARTRSIPKPSGKWTKYLLRHRELASYEVCERSPAIGRLGEYGRTDIGVVTGANSFFVLDAESAAGAVVPDEDLRPAVSKAEHVQGLRLTRIDMKGLAAKGQRTLLLYPREGNLVRTTAAYIRSGEWIGIHNRYKCRNRDPWWQVPGVKVPDAFLTYMSHEAPRLVLNEVRAVSTNTVHGIYLSRHKTLLRGALPVLFLNSLTLLSAEIEGRSYGGGVLKLEPKEVDRLLLPRIEDLPPEVVKALRAMLRTADGWIRSGNLREVVEAVDELVLVRGLGFTTEQLLSLRDARERLLSRRRARMSSSP